MTFFLHTHHNITSSQHDKFIYQNIRHALIIIYDLTGKIQYKLHAHDITHASNHNTIWLFHPKIIIFNKNGIAIWEIIANQAKLKNHEKKLYLYGYIHINNISNTTYFQSIITKGAQINLITQEIIAFNKIIIQGDFFYTIGIQMHINIHTQTIKLINNVQTYYEIKHNP